jgi:hypothetical protein
VSESTKAELAVQIPARRTTTRDPVMPSDPFVHLHVASGYSLRYGASHPHVLVERAAEHGMDTLALTDRDGTYGVVKFVQAAQSAGLRPILGVDLAIEASGLLSGAHPSLRIPARNTRDSTSGRAGDPGGRSAGAPARSTPARGGASVDPRHPRVTLLARQEFVYPEHIHWESDSEVPGQVVTEFAGRLCYLSLGPDAGLEGGRARHGHPRAHRS